MGDPVRLRVAALARTLGLTLEEGAALVELLGTVADGLRHIERPDAPIPKRRRPPRAENETGSLFPPNPPIPSRSLIENGSSEHRLSEEVPSSTRARSIARAQQWPADFTLTAERETVARALGLDVVWEWNSFRDYHRARGSRFVSWPDAWRTWCRRSWEYAQRRSMR